MPCSLCNYEAEQKEPLKEILLERREREGGREGAKETGKLAQPTLFSLETET